MKMKKAFTLAEILLVVAIIGTVSVLTLTNAVDNSNSSQKIAQLRKDYDILQAAFVAGMQDYGPINEWGYSIPDSTTTHTDANKEIVNKVLIPHLKLAKNGNCENTSGCWSKNASARINSIDNKIDNYANFHKFILANGSSVAVYLYKLPTRATNMMSVAFTTATSTELPDGVSTEYGVVYVDVNGPKDGIAKNGDDVYMFYVMPEGLIPAGRNLTINTTTATYCTKFAEKCTAWAFYKGNQDYFKCPTKLSWTDSTKSSCTE